MCCRSVQVGRETPAWDDKVSQPYTAPSSHPARTIAPDDENAHVVSPRCPFTAPRPVTFSSFSTVAMLRSNKNEAITVTLTANPHKHNSIQCKLIYLQRTTAGTTFLPQVPHTAPAIVTSATESSRAREGRDRRNAAGVRTVQPLHHGTRPQVPHKAMSVATRRNHAAMLPKSIHSGYIGDSLHVTSVVADHLFAVHIPKSASFIR
eukprot:SAG31_NODE_2936_length_4892_cov_5.112456_6_plen_206_part_00